MSMSGSKIREQVAHFLVDIHKGILPESKNPEPSNVYNMVAKQ